MVQKFTTHAEAQAAADKMNSERVRTNVGYVASATHEFQDGKMVVVGWHIGMCMDD